MIEIRKLYLANFIYGLGVMAAFTFTLFFLDNGLTQTQIGILFSVFLLSSAFLEIPTGSFADTFGHKASFCLGLFIDAFYYLVFFFSRSFEGFLLGMIVAAVGLSLQSGANSSLVYEILKKEGREDEFAKVWGKIQTMGLIGVVIGAPLATFLYKDYPTLPYLLSFIFVTITAVITYFVKFEFTRSALTVKTYFNRMWEGSRLTFKNRKFLVVVFISLILSTIHLAYLDLINQPLQLDLGVPVQAIGVVQAIASIGSAIATFFAYRVLKSVGNTWALVLAVLLPGISLLLLSQIHAVAGAIFIIFFMVSQVYKSPIIESLQQHEAPSEHRSTMVSAASFITTIIGAILMPFWGALADSSGRHFTLGLMGVFILIFGLAGIFWYYSIHYKAQPNHS